MIAKIANMKKILFLFLLSFTCNAGFAQRFSFSTVEQVEGGGIVYELEKTPVSLTYENILNNKGDAPYVLLDGTPAPGSWDDYDSGELDNSALRRVIREVFTARELEELKKTNSRMTLSLVYDNRGAVIEVCMHFNATSATEALPVGRIAELEKRIKKEVATRITDEATLQLQFTSGAVAYKFRYMDDK